jgi:hypothetical protein
VAEKTAIVITALVLILMALAGVFLPYEQAGQAGDWIGGFGGALAFLWFIIAMNLQRTELATQRQELVLQREALLLQKQELSRMGKFAGYQQISEIMKETKKELSEGDHGIKNISQLITAALPSAEWGTIFNNTNAKEVYDACTKMMPLQGALTIFFASIKQAINIYKESVGAVAESTPDDLAEFVYVNSPWLKNIPHVSQYATTIQETARMYWTVTPGRQAISLAFLMSSAIYLRTTRLIKEPELYKMYLEVKEKGGLPKIAEQYKFSDDVINSGVTSPSE